MGKLAKALTAAAGNAGGGDYYDYEYFAFPMAKANGAANYYDNALFIADISDPTSMSMQNYATLDNGYFNYYMWGLASDPVNKVIFCSSNQGSKLYAKNVPTLSSAWSKNVSGVKTLAHDNENQILYYVSNGSLNAVDSTDGSSLGTLLISGQSMSIDQLFNSVLVDDNSRLVLLQSYVSDAATNCVMTIDVSDPSNMSVDATQALDIYNGDPVGMEWDSVNEIIWVIAYYDSYVYGLIKMANGSGWHKPSNYSINVGAVSSNNNPMSLTFSPETNYVIVGTAAGIFGWDVSTPSSPVNDLSITSSAGNAYRQYSLVYDPARSYMFGTRLPFSTSWGISSYDFSSSTTTPTIYNLLNLGSPYTTYTHMTSYSSTLV